MYAPRPGPKRGPYSCLQQLTQTHKDRDQAIFVFQNTLQSLFLGSEYWVQEKEEFHMFTAHKFLNHTQKISIKNIASKKLHNTQHEISL